ncbi:sugar ABC transporter substrate-binding protein [Salinisphaera hydrothermalis]|uniref:sugar ABC transporter substrate-binding protein n=1 Tax=Salinisphaera hydrothermalis TaxID=563188 RepID=UPI0033639C65
MPTNRRTILKGMAAASMLGATSGGLAWGKDRVFVPFSNKSLNYYFFVTQQEAVKRAVQANGWDFQAVNANFNNTEQLKQWQSLLLRGPSAMISDVIDSQAIVSQIRRYNQRRIPVAIIDTPADGGDVAITVSFDNYQGGVMAAQEIIRRLKQKYGTEKGVVLNCYGALQSVAWRLRKEGFDAEMAKHPDITVLDRPTEGLLKNMLSVTLSTLSERSDLDAVHAPSDSPSRGIVTALKQRGRWKKVGEDGHVIFVNIDGEPIGLEWIKQGYMDADISQDPIAYAEIAVDMLKKYSLQGKAVPLGPYENKKYYWEKGHISQSKSGPALVIPPFVIDKKNADDPRMWGNIAYDKWGLRYS